MKKNLKNQRGQSILEYVLVMMVVLGAVILVLGNLKKSEFFFKKFAEPMVKHITYNYKYFLIFSCLDFVSVKLFSKSV